MVADREWLLQELRKSLRALALPGPEALRTQPDGTAKADELALEYDNFLVSTLDNFESDFTAEQVQALRRVNGLLEEMSGEENAELWTDQAVCSHARWDEVRRLAQQAMQLLGWSCDAG